MNLLQCAGRLGQIDVGREHSCRQAYFCAFLFFRRGVNRGKQNQDGKEYCNGTSTMMAPQPNQGSLAQFGRWPDYTEQARPKNVIRTSEQIVYSHPL